MSESEQLAAVVGAAVVSAGVVVVYTPGADVVGLAVGLVQLLQ